MSNGGSDDERRKLIENGMTKLREEGIKWVEAHKSKRFSGVTKLLTDLYPDNAHFIYELLQNAEDARDKTNPDSQGASVVCFTLNENSLEFEHNGQGLFTLDDVGSITGIGGSNKAQDPTSTSIGKFGVGFKAVFAYTNTPEIHSGDFHFRIHDLVVPDTDGVQYSRIDEQKTRFVFPFDNPRKPREQAINEVERGLNALGDNTLLFLRNIHKIEYLLPDGSLGTLERITHQEGRIEIRARQPDGEETISHWLLFEKDVEVANENGESKNCRIAIAYSLAKEENKKGAVKNWKVVPLDRGQTSIYFPASEEKPNLKFHLHAPFASTVARDVVRKGVKENEFLRDRLSDLAVESLHNIREQGMLTVGFLAVLPNPKDELPEFYEPIRNAIVNAFLEQNLTPTRSSEHRPAKNLYRGPAKIAEVLGDEGLSFFTNSKAPLWAANAPQENQREDQFIQSLKIHELGWSNLLSIFKLPCSRDAQPQDQDNINAAFKERIETFIRKMGNSQLMRFYALMGEAISKNNTSEDVEFSDVGYLRIIRVSTEKGDDHVKPSSAYFSSNDDIAIPSEVTFVKREVYSIDGTSQQKVFAKLFLENVGIRVYDAKADIERILKLYNDGKVFSSKIHLSHIRQFKNYWLENQGSIDIFESIAFLKGQEDCEGNKYFKASELYLDSPYMETGLEALFNDKNLSIEKPKQSLSTEYKSIKKFMEFAVELGVMRQLDIVLYEATEIQKSRFEKVGKRTKSTIDEDYFINGLHWHMESRKGYIGGLTLDPCNSMALSHAIWRVMCEADPKVLTARYVPNQKHSDKPVIDSSFLANYLSKHKWVLDNTGNFRLPCQITRETLHPDFKFDDRNGWLTAIKFGEDSRKQTEEYLAKDAEAKAHGYSSVEEMEKWKKVRDAGLDPEELLAQYEQQKKISQPEDSVEDPVRRRQKVLANAADAPSKESVRKERSIQQGISETTAKAKAYLRTKYINDDKQLVCQCCQKEMPFKLSRSDEYYFEAVQCIEDKDKRNFQSRLALCPTCAAMYQFARETGDAEICNSIIYHKIDDKTPAVKIIIRLAGLDRTLHFVGTHWFDLKTILSQRS